MENALITVGARIYYTGDVANVPDFGVVTEHLPADKYAPDLLVIRLDDGRELRGIDLRSFRPAPGRRFWTAAEWNAERERDLERAKVEAKRGRRATAERMKRERRRIEAGDILYSSWGYDMVNIDFYKVRKRTERMVELVKVGYGSHEHSGFLRGRVTPDPDNEIGEPFRRKVYRFKSGDGIYEESVGITSYSSASRWVGRTLEYDHAD